MIMFCLIRIVRSVTRCGRYDTDMFRRMDVRRQNREFLAAYPPLSVVQAVDSACPVGVLAVRLFTLMLSNDADRCIELRDRRVAYEVPPESSRHTKFSDSATCYQTLTTCSF